MNIKNLLHDLNEEAADVDKYEYGLPIYDKSEFERLVKIVEKHVKVSAKQLVVDLLDDLYGVTSVTKGRGTASNWIAIKTKHSVEWQTRRLVEHQLVKHQLCGSYWPDLSSESSACVNWSLS